MPAAPGAGGDAAPGGARWLVAALAGNTARPGAGAGPSCAGRGGRAGRRRPGVWLGVGAVAYGAGVVGGATRGLRLFALQLALAPETVLAGRPLGASRGVVLLADARAARVLRATALVAGRPRGPERAGAGGWRWWAVARRGLAGGRRCSPGRCRGGGGRTGRTRGGSASTPRSSTPRTTTSGWCSDEGYELGKLGLTLPPGRSGEIVFRLERPAESLVLLRPNFYNVPVDERSVVAGGRPFSNALEVSTDGGRNFRPVLVDTTAGDVLGGAVYDLTPYLGVSREYLLRFRATNTTDGEVTVLPSLMVSVVADPARRRPTRLPPVVAGRWRSPRWGTGWRAGRGAGSSRRRCRAGPGGAGAAGRSGGQGRGERVAGAGSAGSGRLAGRGARRPAPATGLASPLAPAGEPARRAMQGPLLAWSPALVGGRASGGRRARAAETGGVAGPGSCLLVALRGAWRRAGRSWCGCATSTSSRRPGVPGDRRRVPAEDGPLPRGAPDALLEELYASGFDGRASVPAVFYAGGNNGREPLWPATLRLVFNVDGRLRLSHPADVARRSGWRWWR